ncbi:MAG: hypothetical protein WCE44_02530 [Candidatus Velthaea sp.]
MRPLGAIPSFDQHALREQVRWLDETYPGAISDVPDEEWGRLLKLLPRCECGMPLSPGRATRGERGPIPTTCSEKCHYRKEKRAWNKNLERKKKEARLAQAISEAFE